MSLEAPLLHEECWLLLPWLANGRLSASERARLEEHVRACAHCSREVAWQRIACQALAEPERVTYAPGPSFRKLMERIDGSRAAAPSRLPPSSRTRERSWGRSGAWRPPGFAWAAAFVLALGIGALAPIAYRWSQPRYVTYTAAAPRAPDVLHVAFERSLPIGEVEELLRSAGARIVEGPGSSGILGVVPAAASSSSVSGAGARSELRALAARLQADARVRWVEPLADEPPDQPPAADAGRQSMQPPSPSH